MEVFSTAGVAGEGEVSDGRLGVDCAMGVTDSAGATGISTGSTAASAEETMRARTRLPAPYCDVMSSLPRTSAEAPSLKVDELAAVTVPPVFTNSGFSVGTLSSLRFA